MKSWSKVRFCVRDAAEQLRHEHGSLAWHQVPWRLVSRTPFDKISVDDRASDLIDQPAAHLSKFAHAPIPRLIDHERGWRGRHRCIAAMSFAAVDRRPN
ncbi:hypothetical protein AB4Y40_34635 [Paraburkholderia sp. EG287B]|uniref:hypothetical protein n=1 Tax=Paraburkholderia sp. EG287B TaxID=3237010 RepID=UPI0034D32E1D